ncbi:hypothetical protein QR510_30450, partial [Escherichia coli]|uniref:hypothetical protein n=1 Tax=Escherichia coli TaxID=562 RepID=UPI00273A5012
RVNLGEALGTLDASDLVGGMEEAFVAVERLRTAEAEVRGPCEREGEGSVNVVIAQGQLAPLIADARIVSEALGLTAEQVEA